MQARSVASLSRFPRVHFTWHRVDLGKLSVSESPAGAGSLHSAGHSGAFVGGKCIPQAKDGLPAPSKASCHSGCSCYRFSMPPAITAEQFELLSDDPRRESVTDELRQWWQASREMKGLLTQNQAALILGVQTGQIGNWIRRGRLSSRVVAGVRMVGGGEVAALLQERQNEIRKSGGRGVKAPSLSALADAAWTDLGMDEI